MLRRVASDAGASDASHPEQAQALRAAHKCLMQASDVGTSLASEALCANKGWYLELRFDYFHISEAQGTNLYLHKVPSKASDALASARSASCSECCLGSCALAPHACMRGR